MIFAAQTSAFHKRKTNFEIHRSINHRNDYNSSQDRSRNPEETRSQFYIPQSHNVVGPNKANEENPPSQRRKVWGQGRR